MCMYVHMIYIAYIYTCMSIYIHTLYMCMYVHMIYIREERGEREEKEGEEKERRERKREERGGRERGERREEREGGERKETYTTWNLLFDIYYCLQRITVYNAVRWEEEESLHGMVALPPDMEPAFMLLAVSSALTTSREPWG